METHYRIAPIKTRSVDAITNDLNFALANLETAYDFYGVNQPQSLILIYNNEYTTDIAIIKGRKKGNFG